MKKLMSGDEAIAQGAYEAGVSVACAYPGTPSTEILENMAKYDEVYCEWGPNEKVALEVAIGASIAGGRALAAMKHVGVNVAADPLFSFTYTGVNGGLVLVSADDPNMYSSQNEQDNRYYAKFAKAILLEPSDSQEAKDFTKVAFEISERFDMPVLLRITMRIAHSKSMVLLGEKLIIPLKQYTKNVQKFVLMPAVARNLRKTLEERLEKATEFASEFQGNFVEGKGEEFAIITSGISYQYAKEALGDKATYLKLGWTFPMPRKLIENFLQEHSNKKIYIIEEGEPFLEEQIRSWGYHNINGKNVFSNIGELSVAIIADKVLGLKEQNIPPVSLEIPARPPVLCPACPHRAVYYTLGKFDAIISGDIGCYTLGVMPPLSKVDNCICMGASITAALGISKVRPKEKVIATIGDSTFFHSGITGLIDAVYNQGKFVVMILDNGITAMTGHQENPATGKTIKQEITNRVDIEEIVRACGVKNIQVVQAYQMTLLEEAIKKALDLNELAVIIVKQPCIFVETDKKRVKFTITDDCKQCRACLKLGCPAIETVEERILINQSMCNGCSMCVQVCKFKAIKLSAAQGGGVK